VSIRFVFLPTPNFPLPTAGLDSLGWGNKRQQNRKASVAGPAFLHINSQSRIPALYRVRGKLRRESRVPDENRDRGYKWVSAFAGTTTGFPVSSTGQA